MVTEDRQSNVMCIPSASWLCLVYAR